jgi:hypothetical protein
MQRIHDKLRGLEFHNPNKCSQDAENLQQSTVDGMQPARGAFASHIKSYNE